MRKLLLAIIICGCAGRHPAPQPEPEPPAEVRFKDATLSWNARPDSENVTHYLAHHGKDSTRYADVEATADTFYVFGNTDGGQWNFYCVQAVNSVGPSDCSRAVYMPPWFEIAGDTLFAGDSRVMCEDSLVVEKIEWGDPPQSIPWGRVWELDKYKSTELSFNFSGSALSLYQLEGRDDFQFVDVYINGNRMADLVIKGEDQPKWVPIPVSPSVKDAKCQIFIRTEGERYRLAAIAVEK